MRTHGLWPHSRKGIQNPSRADGARCASLRFLPDRGRRCHAPVVASPALVSVRQYLSRNSGASVYESAIVSGDVPKYDCAAHYLELRGPQFFPTDLPRQGDDTELDEATCPPPCGTTSGRCARAVAETPSIGATEPSEDRRQSSRDRIPVHHRRGAGVEGRLRSRSDRVEQGLARQT